MEIMPEKCENITMVYVTQELEYNRLVQEANRISDESGTKLYMVNVQKRCEWGKKPNRRVEDIMRLSKSLNVEMLVFFSDNPVKILKDCVERTQAKHVILSEYDKQSEDIAKELSLNNHNLNIHICTA